MATMLYQYDGVTLETTLQRFAQVVGGKELWHPYATTTPIGPTKTGYTQIWRPKAADASYPYANLALDIASSGDDGDWLYIEDHRQQTDDKGVTNGGTAYWLPADGDNYASPARYMEAPGPLPAGAVTIRPDRPAPTAKEQTTTIRAERDRRIAATDYLVMPDYPIAANALAAVKTYRQALRDLPARDGFPWDGDIAAAPWPALPDM